MQEYSQRGPTKWCSKETASWWRLKKREEILLHQQIYIYTAPWMWFKGDILCEYSGSCPVTVQSCTNVFFVCLKHSVLPPVSLRPSLLNVQSALIGQLTHAWSSTANNNWAALLNQFLGAKLVIRHKLCKCVTELKAGLLARCLRSRVFCGREELLLVAVFDLFDFQELGGRALMINCVECKEGLPQVSTAGQRDVGGKEHEAVKNKQMRQNLMNNRKRWLCNVSYDVFPLTKMPCTGLDESEWKTSQVHCGDRNEMDLIHALIWVVTEWCRRAQEQLPKWEEGHNADCHEQLNHKDGVDLWEDTHCIRAKWSQDVFVRVSLVSHFTCIPSWWRSAWWSCRPRRTGPPCHHSLWKEETGGQREHWSLGLESAKKHHKKIVYMMSVVFFFTWCSESNWHIVFAMREYVKPEGDTFLLAVASW